MSIYNILVAFNGSESAVSALKYAASLARNGAHVTALLAHSKHEVIESRAAWVPAKAREIIEQANADILDEIEVRFEAMRDGLALGDRLHFQREAGRVDAVISECARGYDILIMGQDRSEGTDEHVIQHPDRIALMSGRPVLIVPEGYDAVARHERAAIVWDGSRASARALSDSLGVLEDQGEVTVLTVEDQPTPRPVLELMQHLERHQINASHKVIAPVPGIARALIAYCAENDPCVLVMGAYEHSKFREDFLGGVTARVLKNTSIPVLLSH
ncbi:universal stress protein [Roseibium polysiphoniae]|uniref:Universal stress protein n=1 Tax=Roseibium polysiphoniae TaxID=2571221 RepID=A0A944C8F6_9HYPH|nr:universal stress protein [Roseibium polysiphoniae]MBS8259003.1 universal stress protein [Roseibium polysiphoniae]